MSTRLGKYRNLVVRAKQAVCTQRSNAQSTSTIRHVDQRPFRQEQETKPFHAIPGQSGIYNLPIIGTVLQFKPFTKYEYKRIHELLRDLTQTYGSVTKIRLGMEWIVLVSDPDDIQKVYRNEGKYPVRGDIPLLEVYLKRKNISPSFAILNGKEWADLRRPAQMSMRKPHTTAKFVPKISEVADDFVEKYRKSKRMDNLPLQCMEYSTEGIGLLCFNTRLGCIDMTDTGHYSEIMDNVKTFFNTFGQQFYIIPWFRLFEDKVYKAFEKSMDYIMDVSKHNIGKAMERLRDEKHIADEDGDLLTDMLSTPNMTPEMVNRNLIDLFTAGVDSTALSMTFLLYQLAKHPDVQEKLFKELEPLVTPKGRLDRDVLQKTRYLKACLKESFRLVYPIGGGTQRILTNDISLQGYNVPKGTKFFLLNLVVGMDEKYFAEPEKYIPERWMRDERVDPVHPFAHLPFGFGPRSCIGQRFAEMEIYIGVAKLIRNYRLSLPPGMTELQYEYNTFATPIHPFSILLEERSIHT